MNIFMARWAQGILCTGLLALGSTLDAATSGPFTTTTPIPLTYTDWSLSLSLPKFDSALGTLNSVRIDLSGGISSVLTISNSISASSSSVGDGGTRVRFSVQDSGNHFSTPEITTYSDTYSYNLLPGESVTTDPLTGSGSYAHTYTLQAILDEFTGPGTITLPASTLTTSVMENSGGNYTVQQVTRAELTATVTYDYTAVPEPGSLALLGLGGLMVLLVKRRALGRLGQH
jgi:hypothetical protein